MSRPILVLAAAALVLAPSGSRAQEQVRRLSDGPVAIYNLVGETRVVPGREAGVVVRATMRGADAARLELRTLEVDGREALTVVYPEDRVVYPGMGSSSRTTQRVRHDGVYGMRRGDEITVRGSGRGMEAWADLVVEVPRGAEVAVHLARGETAVEGVDGLLTVDTGSGAVRARDVRGALTVDTGSGSVEVTGMDGRLMVDTGSGGVALRNVRGGDVRVDTGSGAVSGGAIESASVEVDTGSGSIDLAGVSASDLILDTGSGSVDVALTGDVRRLIVDTGSGSVTVRAPDTLGAEVEIDTGSGGIDVDFPLRIRSARRDHVAGTLGDGRGEIRIDTGSGRVRLLRGG